MLHVDNDLNLLYYKYGNNFWKHSDKQLNATILYKDNVYILQYFL